MMDAATSRPIRQRDAEGLTGVLAVLTGALLGGVVDEKTLAGLVRVCVGAGLLSDTGAGSQPTAGQLVVALEDLLQRLRYSLGEMAVEPDPRPDPVTVHLLGFATEEVARRFVAEASEHAGVTASVEPLADSEWLVWVCHNALPPDLAFREMERLLMDGAARAGGRYRGSQTVPQRAAKTDEDSRSES